MSNIQKTEKTFLGLDSEFLPTMLMIAVPMALHLGYQYTLSLIDTYMISSMGEKYMTAVGLSNELFYLYSNILAGIVTGSSVFTAQYWGVRDTAKIKRTIGLAITIGFVSAIISLIIGQFFGRQFIGFYSKDEEVITLGIQFLKVVSFSYIFSVVGWVTAVILRTMGEARLPLINAVITLSVNTFFNYALIYGNFGFPKMGMMGVAFALTITRVLDTCIMLCFLLTFKPIRGKIHEYFQFFDAKFVKQYFKVITPAILNLSLYAAGSSVYSYVFAHLGVDIMAAYQTYRPFTDMVIVFPVALATASFAMIGNKLGQGESVIAFRYAKRFIFISLGASVLIALAVFIASSRIINIYNYKPETKELIHRFLWVAAIGIPLRSLNIALITGTLRTGGSTMFVMMMELVCLWCFGSGLAIITGLHLQFEPFWVLLLTMTDELVKNFVGLYRFVSRKWIKNLTVD